MIVQESSALKKPLLGVFLFLCSIIFAYVGLVLMVSFWIGLKSIYRTPSWVPIMVGIIGIIGLVYAFIRITIFTVKHMTVKS